MNPAEYNRYLELLMLLTNSGPELTEFNALQAKMQNLMDHAFQTLQVLRQATFALDCVVMLTGNKTLIPYLDMRKAQLELFKD